MPMIGARAAGTIDIDHDTPAFVCQHESLSQWIRPKAQANALANLPVTLLSQALGDPDLHAYAVLRGARGNPGFLHPCIPTCEIRVMLDVGYASVARAMVNSLCRRSRKAAGCARRRYEAPAMANQFPPFYSSRRAK